jgi:hypothetical protein
MIGRGKEIPNSSLGLEIRVLMTVIRWMVRYVTKNMAKAKAVEAHFWR